MKANELYKQELARIDKAYREKRLNLILKEKDVEIKFLNQRSEIRDKRSSEYARYKVACSIADQNAIEYHMKKLNDIETEELMLKNEYKASKKILDLERQEIHGQFLGEQICAKQTYKSIAGQEIAAPEISTTIAC